MGNGNPRDASMLIALAVFTIPVIVVYLWMMIKNWVETVNNSADITNKYKYNNEYRDNHSGKYKDRKTRTYLEYDDDKRPSRDHPPNASFFCRVDGKETFIEGPPEEEFLTRYEAIKWKYKKRKRELKKEFNKS